MQYSGYELSDEHMRGLIHGSHPSLDLIRKGHFDAWLEAHDRRVKAEAWDESQKVPAVYNGPDSGHYEDCMGYEDCYCAEYPNPYRTED